MDTSTDSYDKAFSEACLDIVAFGDENTNWYCLDGGSRVLPDSMEAYINARNPKALLKQKMVTKLCTIQDKPSKKFVGMDVYVNGEASPRQYSHVISTLPLPVVRSLNLDDDNLFDIEQWNALRELSYGPSVKIGVKFKTQWWKYAKSLDGQDLDITGGQSYTDRVIRRVVYPSYGVKSTSETTVLIASYTWTSDASSMGALTSDDPATRERLKNLVLNDLANLHNVSLSTLQDEYLEMHPWAWQNDPLTQGAFAFFGPGQFSNLYPSLTTPCGQGRLHMAGEALSPRHAWIVGALDASWRAVYDIVLSDYYDKKEQFEEKRGKNEEWVPSARFQSAIGAPNQPYDLFMVHREVRL